MDKAKAIETLGALIHEMTIAPYDAETQAKADEAQDALNRLTETIEKLEKRNSDLQDAYDCAYDYLDERGMTIDDPENNDE